MTCTTGWSPGQSAETALAWVPSFGDYETAPTAVADDATPFDVSWLVRAEQLGPDAFDHAHLTCVFNSIETLMRAGHTGLLGSMLASLRTRQISPQVLISALRGSVPVKELVPGWVNVRNAVRDELVRRGLDADRLLRGL